MYTPYADVIGETNKEEKPSLKPSFELRPLTERKLFVLPFFTKYTIHFIFTRAPYHRSHAPYLLSCGSDTSFNKKTTNKCQNHVIEDNHVALPRMRFSVKIAVA